MIELVLLDVSGAVLSASKTALALMGLPKQANFEGLALSSLLDRSHPLLATVEAAIANNTEAHEVTIAAGDGEQAEHPALLVSLYRLKHGRKNAGFLVTLREKVPRESLREQLPDSKVSTEQEAWISDAAHQLRGPLHGMNMRLELLKREVGDSPTQRHIEKLNYQVQRLDQAVEELLRACGRKA
jgi:signal transduction histidine kinase